MLPVLVVGGICCGVAALAPNKKSTPKKNAFPPSLFRDSYRVPIRDVDNLEWDEKLFVSLVAEDYLEGNDHSEKILATRALNKMYPILPDRREMRWPTVPGDDPGLVGLEKIAHARVQVIKAQARYYALISTWGVQT